MVNVYKLAGHIYASHRSLDVGQRIVGYSCLAMDKLPLPPLLFVILSFLFKSGMLDIIHFF